MSRAGRYRNHDHGLTLSARRNTEKYLRRGSNLTSDPESAPGLKAVGLETVQAGVPQSRPLQDERVLLPVRADAAAGLGLELRPVSAPGAGDVGHAERHLEGAALALGHLHILQTLHQLQGILWNTHTHISALINTPGVQTSEWEELTCSSDDPCMSAVSHPSGPSVRKTGQSQVSQRS